MRKMSFQEFASNLENVFESLAAGDEPVLVERGQEVYRVEAEGGQSAIPWDRYDPAEVLAALEKSTNVLRGVDTDKLLADLRAERTQDGRFLLGVAVPYLLDTD